MIGMLHSNSAELTGLSVGNTSVALAMLGCHYGEKG
jgi:hypothetical protein